MYLDCGILHLDTNSALLLLMIGEERGWIKQFKPSYNPKYLDPVVNTHVASVPIIIFLNASNKKFSSNSLKKIGSALGMISSHLKIISLESGFSLYFSWPLFVPSRFLLKMHSSHGVTKRLQLGSAL